MEPTASIPGTTNDVASLERTVVGIIEEAACVQLTRELYDTDLTQLGIDSLMALDIANEIESALDTVIDDRDVLRFRNVTDILDHLRAPSARP